MVQLRRKLDLGLIADLMKTQLKGIQRGFVFTVLQFFVLNTDKVTDLNKSSIVLVRINYSK